MSAGAGAVDRSRERERMVAQQLRARGIADPRVLAAFLLIPRERFLDARLGDFAYDDGPVPIGFGQTLSQPFVVAVMVEALEIHSTDRVLEVGAGSGYAAAILSRLATRVTSIERHAPLADDARQRLAALGCTNVAVHHGDGTGGWPEAAPFDAILVSAGGAHVPPALIEQLAPGGRLVMPVGGDEHQQLMRLEKSATSEIEKHELGPVSFVPLVSGSRDDEPDAEDARS